MNSVFDRAFRATIPWAKQPDKMYRDDAVVFSYWTPSRLAEQEVPERQVEVEDVCSGK